MHQLIEDRETADQEEQQEPRHISKPSQNPIGSMSITFCGLKRTLKWREDIRTDLHEFCEECLMKWNSCIGRSN